MAKQLRPTEAGTRGVQRLVRKEVGKALEALSGESQPLSAEAVHEARKRLKKARAGLRLLREALGTRLYHRETVCLRDAGRPLTQGRDAQVPVDAIDELVEQGGVPALARVRQSLLDHQRAVRQRVLEEGDTLGPVKESLQAAWERAKDWPVGRRGRSVLGGGLERVYRQGRDS